MDQGSGSSTDKWINAVKEKHIKISIIILTIKMVKSNTYFIKKFHSDTFVVFYFIERTNS